MNTSEIPNSHGIHSDGGTLVPFRYPGGIRQHFSDEQLAETETWLRKVNIVWAGIYGYYLQGLPDEESKKQLLTYYTSRAHTEARLVDGFFAANQNRRVESLVAGSWFMQRNAYGMNTCQFASAINALRFLGAYNPQIHTEEAFINALGGRRYAINQQSGAETWDIERVLPSLAPAVKFRRSNSVSEMIKAAADGAAVMFPYSNDHEALIPPGFNLRRDVNGGLEVQVANSLSFYPEYLSTDRLIKSEITTAIDLDTLQNQNSVLIIERATLGIRTVLAQESGIRTVRH